MASDRVYFPNLSGLRFFAALAVIVHHVEQYRHRFGVSSGLWREFPFLDLIGKLGVIFFFVLSGYLITALLLRERDDTGGISIRKFYVRRSLRIWPLYYLLIGLGLWVLPKVGIFDSFYSHSALSEHGTEVTLLYVFFLSNVALPLYGYSPFISHTWSIGTEEQYYLFWPHVVKKSGRHLFAVMVILVGLLIIVNNAVTRDITPLFGNHSNAVRRVWWLLNIDCMIIGGMFAYLLHLKHPVIDLLRRPLLFFTAIIITVPCIMLNIRFPYINFELYSFLFGIIILNLSTVSAYSRLLEYRVLNHLGNVSYGLYMYHPFAIISGIMLLRHFNIVGGWPLYVLSISLTVILASMSYRWIERPFLRLKDRFSVVISGPSPKT